MQNTTNYGWTYPDAPDHTRTWEYWAVFEDVDATLKGIDDRVTAIEDDGLPIAKAKWTGSMALTVSGVFVPFVPASLLYSRPAGFVVGGNNVVQVTEDGLYDADAWVRTTGLVTGSSANQYWHAYIINVTSGATLNFGFAPGFGGASATGLVRAPGVNISAGDEIGVRINTSTAGVGTALETRLSLRRLGNKVTGADP
ncbi:hypothetical protein AB0M47_33235 [Hamadaea sp. NPDC051192]|uniref:hypothetical protein n=1 Tax=Hamadaea sp. NPDC051192 TaxID=3154940 RepID=UPI00344239F0